MPVVRIIEELCDGCGACIPACHEGALRLVNGKAVLVDAAACDGAGACIGDCPRGAIELVETPPVSPSLNGPRLHPTSSPAGCPGTAHRSLGSEESTGSWVAASALRQWPIQLHLLSPAAPFLRGSHLLLAADCAAYACASFHTSWLTGHTLAIACPKLDVHQELYEEKLIAMLQQVGLASLTVLIMEVPCCSGLARLAQRAVQRAGVAVPVRVAVLNLGGELIFASASSLPKADAG